MPAPPFIAPTTEPQTYTGVCRCKANKFTIDIPKLTGAFKCNCSICSLHDNFWAFRKPGGIVFEREGEHIVYQWGERKYSFYFCATCGNLIKGILNSSGGIAVNLRLLQDVDIWSLKPDPLNDGAANGRPYQPPQFTGPAFAGDAGDKTKVYHGSCHCGAVTVALRSKPLPEVDMIECNCAYCCKDARIHIYPSSDNVHIGGAENLKAFMSNPAGGGFFCKLCGVPVLDADLDGARDGDGKVIPDAKETLGHDLHVCAVNVRTLRGVEWDDLKIVRYDGRSKDPQFTAD